MKNNEMLNLIVNSTREAIIVCDTEENIVYWNNASKEMFGYEFEEVQGQRINRVLKLKMLPTETLGSFYDMIAEKKDGSVFPIEMSMSAAGQGHSVILIKDITDKQEVQDEVNFRRNLENIVTSFSTKFINADIDNINNEINKSIQEAGVFLKAERGYLYLLDEKDDVFKIISEWKTKECKSKFNILENKDLLNELMDGKYYLYPGYSINEKINLELQKNNLNFFAAVPINRASKKVGFLVFESSKKENKWTENIMGLLNIIGEIFLNSLDRKKMEEFLLDGNNELLEFTSRLKKLHKLNITSYINIEKMYEDYIKKGCEVFDSEIGMIGLFKDEKIKSISKSKEGWEDNEEIEFEISESCFKESIEEKTTLINNMKNCKVKRSCPKDAKYFICTPIFLSDKVYGIIVFYSKKEKKEYNSEDVVLIELMAKGVGRFLEIKEGEEKLLEAKEEAEASNRSKSQFLANMSHELRTPMNSIIGFSEMLFEEERDKEKKDTLEIIVKSSKNLLYLINDILDFSKIEAGKVELSEQIFSIKNLLKEIHDLFSSISKEKSIYFEVDNEKNVPVLMLGDDLRIKQILINLVGNAFKFTQIGGKIKINCFYTEDKILKFAVSDSGIGIPKSQQNKIFKVFTQADSSTTRKYGGTGLGLAVSRGFVELMKGKIYFESFENKGTTFFVELKLKEINDSIMLRGEELVQNWLKDPDLEDLVYDVIRTLPERIKELEESVLNEDPKQIDFISHKLAGLTGNLQMMEIYKNLRAINDEILKKQYNISDIKEWLKDTKEIISCIPKKYMEKEILIKIENLENNKSNLRVLVAEDSEHNQIFIRKVLYKIGIECDLAGNGQIALNMLKEKRYDLLLLDMHMPVKDGMETLQEIRADNDLKKIYIIALTANAIAGDREKYLEAGCDDYISKPIDREILYTKLDTLERETKKIVIEKNDEEDLKEILKKLKGNLQIFEPEEIIELGLQLEEISDNFKNIKDELQDIADSFDEEELKRVINKLEKIA